MIEYAKQYKEELIEKIIPFWMNHSQDQMHGGYLTCLDRKGDVFDSDKFIWLQGREVWFFAMAYDQIDSNPEWKKMALHGADFLLKNGRDINGDWYFSLNRVGEPLVKPYNIFSDCFAAMAFAALYKIEKNEIFAKTAIDTFNNILKRKHNSKGDYNKIFAGTRDLKGFSLPMILCNLSLEMSHLLDPDLVKALIDDVINEVMYDFYDEASGLIMENVFQDGSLSDSFEGRLINPGHAIEAMWFIMDLADRISDKILMAKALERALFMIDYGWDKKHGGIFYFLDRSGHPPQQLEWDQKLWWVHLESLVCMSKAYQYTGDPRAMIWFEKLHDYTWSHFKDTEYPEWFGYLNREGNVLLDLKGGKWKGCFHVPRALFQVNKALSLKGNS